MKLFKQKKINFSFLKKKNSELKEDDHINLDKKLVYSLSPHKIPNLKQIKYVKKVLNRKEKIIVFSSLFVIFCFLFYISFSFYKRSVEIVPTIGGSYSEAILGFPKNINPLYDLARDADRDISRLVFSSLFKRDANGVLIEDLVVDYSASDDAKEYFFEIERNVLWHHGEYLSADDIVFTFNAIKNPDYASPLRSSFIGVEIEKIDDYNFKFILVEPYAAFLDLLTFGIISQNLWMSIEPKNAPLAELNLKPVGSGPYKFNSLTKNKLGEIKEMSFIANDDYYGKRPYITNITFKFFTYFSELSAALNNNIVEGVSYLPHNLKSDLISQNSLNFYNLDLPQISSLFFNSKNNSYLENKNIKKALVLSLDREKLISEIFGGNAGKAYGPILPSSFAYNNEIEKYNYNLEEAKNILKELEWSEMIISQEDYNSIKKLVDLENNKVELVEVLDEESDEILESNQEDVLKYQEYLQSARVEAELLENWQLKKKIITDLNKNDYEIIGTWLVKGSDYLFFRLTTIDLPDNIDVANFIKNSWEEIGVKTFVKIINSAQIQTDILRNKNFEILLLSQVVGTDPDSYIFWHSSQSGEGGLNITSYRNREVDKLLEEARMTLNLDERIEKYQKFQELLNNDLPAFFLYFPTYTYIQNKKIKGFDVSAISDPADRFNNISNWYIKTKRILNF